MAGGRQNYAAVRLFASINRILSALVVLLAVLAGLYGISQNDGALITVAAGAGLAGLWGLAASGLLDIAADIAADMRTIATRTRTPPPPK